MMERQYLIIPKSEIKKVDFEKILEHSPDTLSFSADGKKTFIKWFGPTPEFVSELQNVEGPFTHEGIKEIINSKDWTTKAKRSTKKVT